jgi:hypothetical protein
MYSSYIPNDYSTSPHSKLSTTTATSSRFSDRKPDLFNKEAYTQSSPTSSTKTTSTSSTNTNSNNTSDTTPYNASNLKKSLENWKFVIVHFNDLIEWEHQYDPLIILSANTFIFGLLMYYNPSVLTTASLLGLCFLLFESIVPILLSYILKKAPWNAHLETKYNKICEKISTGIQYTQKLKFRLENIREERHSLYFCIVLFALIFFGYIGQCVDNVLLTYITGNLSFQF